MNKKRRFPSGRAAFGPSLWAGRLMMICLPLITGAVCAVAAMAYEGIMAGEAGLWIRLGDHLAAIGASLDVMLVGAVMIEWKDIWKKEP
ncbi:MAG: hypothetical protein MJ192_00065 [Clostridia bacterium]|nr:hypothetical protein [Clostridia bacterium]